MRLRPVVPALAAVLVLGLIHLPFPLAWDQAVFAMGGEVLARGGALYRDFWDSNQPGIFVFYAAAGRLFGFTEAGIHGLELIVQMAFAIAIVGVLRKSFAHPVSLALAPLLAVGFQYAITSDWHLTQKESLLGLPFLLAMHGALQGGEQRTARHFLGSGIAGGTAIVVKLLLLPIVGAFWMIGLVRLAMHRRSSSGGAVVRAILAVTAGATIPLALAVLMLARTGSLDAAWWTTFQFPMRAMRHVSAWNTVYFVDSLKWIAREWIPLWLFGVPGTLWALRRDRWLASGLLAWIVVGLASIAIQRLSGWQYQFMLVLPPLGLLAAFGVDGALEWTRARMRSRIAVPLTLALLIVSCLPAVGGVARKLVHLSHHEWASTPRGRRDFQIETSRGNAYGRWQACAAFLSEPDAAEGPIFAMGDPVLYWVAGRRPAVPRCGGTMMNQLTRAEWQTLVDAIDRTTPYVFVSRADHHLLDVLQPDSQPMFALLAQRYRPLRNEECGTWYQHR